MQNIPKNWNYCYDDFLDKEKIKHRYFVLENRDTFDKRVLTSIEEVLFAGKFILNPTILGFRNLNDAKVYLVGPKPSRKHSRPIKKDFYSHERKEETKDLFKEAEKARKLNSSKNSSR